MKCYSTISRESCLQKPALSKKLTALLVVLCSLSASAESYSSKIPLRLKKLAAAEASSSTEARSGERNTAQPDVVINGRVIDAQGEPLIGVSVKIKGTTRGASTDVNGQFTLTAPENATLEIAYIGYETREFPLKGQRNVTITLNESVSELDEVVVIGYGAVKKRDVTGSVGSVDAETLTARGTTSVMAALQGAVPGVDISTNSVRPGGGFEIQIRGQNSLEGGSPLYVVDGIVMGDINFLNPADIEKIDILKDASSTAIYGSRGSNGVVIVQTKNANLSSTARTTVSYDGYYGTRTLARIPDFMDGREWVDFRTSAYYTWNVPTNSYVLTDGNRRAILQQSPLLERRLYEEDYEDWLGLGTQNGKQQNHYVNIAGNAKDISYNVGVGYQNEEGNFISEDLNRYNLKLSLAHKINEKLSVGANLNLSQTVTNQGSQYGYRDILRIPNILKAYDENGNMINQPGIAASIQGVGNFTSSPNPLLEINSGNQETRRYDVLGSVYGQFTPIAGLDIRTSFMPRFNRNRVGRYYGIVAGGRGQDEAYQQNDESLDYTWDNQISYQKTFAKDHTINATLINSFYRTRFERIQAGVVNLPYNSEWYNLFSGELQSGNSNTSYRETSLLSYAARANYDYKNRYLLTGTIRYDGSSKLADKWSAFPSLAVAWRVSEEDFLKSSKISDLKARFSFGYSGNNNGIDPYGTQLSPITDELVWYDFGGSENVVSGFAPGAPVNSQITWEKTRELNFGIDFGFFNQRLFGTVDVYDKLSDGLLMSRTLTVESGVASMTDNIGSVNNRGVEIALTTLNVNTSKLRWTTSFNFAHNKNAIRSLYGKKEDVPRENRFIGEPINVIYDYRMIGVWKTSERAEAAEFGQQPGQARVQDIDGDHAITAERDRVILGTPDPSWTGNFNSSLSFKNFDFSFNIFTRQGVFVSDRFLEEFGPGNTQRGRPKINFDYFVPAGVPRYDWNNWGTSPEGAPQATWGEAAGNENAKHPAINNAGPYYGGNGRYTDASFVKVRNIILGYTIPQRLLGKSGISQLRVYANILNPFVFTDYEGWDPEYATTTLQNGNGPSNVTYQFGVNLKF